MSLKLTSLFDNSRAGKDANPTAVVGAQAIVAGRELRDAVRDMATATKSEARIRGSYPFPRPCPRRPGPMNGSTTYRPTINCDPVPEPIIDAHRSGTDEKQHRTVLAGASEEAIKGLLPVIIEGAGHGAERAGDRINDEGARRAREGAERQREAERRWEGRPRNYPQYGR
jgi:hypothetical protein